MDLWLVRARWGGREKGHGARRKGWREVEEARLILICSSGPPLPWGLCPPSENQGKPKGRAGVEEPAFKDPSPRKTTGSASGPFTYLHPSYKVTKQSCAQLSCPCLVPPHCAPGRGLVALLPSL